MTRISVIIPSYNHEPFIAEAIRSVLAQSYSDFELIIVDDHSTDGSLNVIDTIADPRIHRLFLERNIGGAAALNTGIRISRGDYVALCNSDDAWHPDKLRRQVEILDAHPEIAAVFSDVDWIDGAGAPLDSRFNWLKGTFTTPNRSSGSWIRHLVEHGNCLCHPSILIRRSVYDKIGFYNTWLRQLPDLEMWLRLLSRHTIFVMADRLVRFRWHDRNASRPSRSTSRRSINEYRLIVRSLFDRIDAETFGAAFGWLAEDEDGGAKALTWEKALYLMACEGPHENVLRQLGWEYAAEMLLPLPSELPTFVAKRFDPFVFQEQLSTFSPWLRTWLSESSPVAIGNPGTVATIRRLLTAVARRIKSRFR